MAPRAAPSASSTLLPAALDCAARGWPVFPVHWIRDAPAGSQLGFVCSCLDPLCPSPGKHPITPSGVLDATRDEAAIRAWWGQYPKANYGVQCGAESGLVVLDIDPRNGGDVELSDLTGKHGRLPDTPQVLTGGGGEHYYFKHPGTRVKGVPLASGLDLKADGGYVVGPGSRHASGKTYEWELSSHPNDVPVAALPDWLLHLIGQSGSVASSSSSAAKAKLPTVIGHARNVTLTQLAGGFRRHGMSPAEIYVALQGVNQQRCRPPLDDAEVRGIAEGMERYVPGSPVEDEVDLLLGASAPHVAGAPPSANGHTAGAAGPPPAPPGAAPPSGGAGAAPPVFPRILTNNRPLREVSDEALDALKTRNQPVPTLFERSGCLVRVRPDERGRPIIDRLAKEHLRGRLARAADFYIVGQTGLKHVSPPSDVVDDVLIRADWAVPGLDGVIEAPALRPDGSVLDTPGYDAATRLLYQPDRGLVVPPVPPDPSAEDVRAAVELVNEAIGEFPYVDEASRANAWALLLTPIVRPAIAGCVPLCLLDKPKAGTGASRLAEVVGIVSTGRPPGMLGVPKDDDEWRKQITGQLRQGASLIVIDNVTDELGSQHLDRALTAQVWGDRLLQVSESVGYPQRATWIATGNNLTVRRDFARRCYTCRMDARMAQPWTRHGFKHEDLLEWVSTHRGELVAALLTIARAWFAAGRPDPVPPVPPIGNFEQWCRIVGGIVAHAGVPAFLANLRAHWQASDREEAEWEGFLRAWRVTLGDTQVRAGELTKALLDAANFEFREALPDPLDDALDQEEAALRSTRPGNAGSFTKVLGRALARKVGTRYGYENLRLERRQDLIVKVAKWQVVTDAPP